MYTDGVPEATDTQSVMFGTGRMLEALNHEPDAGPKKLIRNVHQDVDAFVGEAEQFDDTTMLCLVWNGPEKE